METVKMQTNSLAGGDLPEDFKLEKPVITLENDTPEPFPKGDMLTLFIEGARVRAQRVLRAKGVEYLKGKTAFTLKMSELFERRSGVKVLTPEQYIDMILASGDKAKIAELREKLGKN
ncbi:MAG TPA: hypothetical protein DCR68_02325 [Coprothermobacter sp.]|nr:hypothetical protein [Coprothermobacter sp.]